MPARNRPDQTMPRTCRFFPAERLADDGEHGQRRDDVGGSSAEQKNSAGANTASSACCWRWPCSCRTCRCRWCLRNKRPARWRRTGSGELAGMIRLAWLGTFGLCLLLAVGTFIWQKHILAGWQITNPADLWITLFVILFSLLAADVLGRAAGTAEFSLARLGEHLQRRGAAGCGVVPGAGVGRLRRRHDVRRVPGTGRGGRRRHLANARRCGGCRRSRSTGAAC